MRCASPDVSKTISDAVSRPLWLTNIRPSTRWLATLPSDRSLDAATAQDPENRQRATTSPSWEWRADFPGRRISSLLRGCCEVVPMRWGLCPSAGERMAVRIPSGATSTKWINSHRSFSPSTPRKPLPWTRSSGCFWSCLGAPWKMQVCRQERSKPAPPAFGSASRAPTMLSSGSAIRTRTLTAMRPRRTALRPIESLITST